MKPNARRSFVQSGGPAQPELGIPSVPLRVLLVEKLHNVVLNRYRLRRDLFELFSHSKQLSQSGLAGDADLIEVALAHGNPSLALEHAVFTFVEINAHEHESRFQPIPGMPVLKIQ